MSENDVQITYNENQSPLADALAAVTRHGTFCHAASCIMPMPVLEVSGVGVLSFPLPPEQASQLAAVAERAPYGKGDKTVVDENVRKVLQISHDKIRLGGDGWLGQFDGIVADCARALGCAPDSVGAEFYKLLLYEKGGFFAAHRDTEKSGAMFGTLVVALPSRHSGGDLLVRHGGKERRCSLVGSDPGRVQVAAFYADCEHEVEPVTDGHRLALVFQLVHTTSDRHPTPADHRDAIAQTAPILREWADSPAAPDKLVYLLEHHYTEATLAFKGLKNSDAARAHVLSEAAALAGCALHLAIVHIEESGWAEHTGHYQGYRRRSRWYDDDDDDDDQESFEIGEVCDGEYYLSAWRSEDDAPQPFGRIPLEEAELLPQGALDNEPNDAVHFSEATGNEGASFERTYLRAALVVWPLNRFDSICISAGIDAAVARFGHYVAAANRTRADDRPAARARARAFANLLPLEWDPYADHDETLARLLNHLRALKDDALTLRIAAPLLADHFTPTIQAATAKLLIAAAPETACSLLASLVTAKGEQLPGPCIEFWMAIAEKDTDFAVADHLIDAIRQAVPWKPTPARRSWRHPSVEEDESQCSDSELSAGRVTPSVLAAFLGAIDNYRGGETLSAAIESITSNTDAFPPEELLLVLLESHHQSPPLPDAASIALWEHCAGFFLNRSAAPPEPPKDWAQEFTPRRQSPHMNALAAFARDPDAREKRFPLRQDLRQEIHQAINDANLDMTHVTERKGSPYVLVCTKTRRSYEGRCARHRADLACMRRLLAIGGATTPASTRSKLENALASTS